MGFYSCSPRLRVPDVNFSGHKAVSLVCFSPLSFIGTWLDAEEAIASIVSLCTEMQPGTQDIASHSAGSW